MEVMYLLIAFSLLIASGFLLAFIWAVRSGQYDDRYTPSVRMLMDDIMPGKKTGSKRAAPEGDNGGGMQAAPEGDDGGGIQATTEGDDSRSKRASPGKKVSDQKKNQQNKIKHTE
ncbi:MAG: cbb3-type cytochrome oxidase assembly protein CcoS [Balneolaceae bacterium]|nr:MAG: cbb3-type cytochrome oxidase assembly protein CcoS [Balneolaceae bacterium]